MGESKTLANSSIYTSQPYISVRLQILGNILLYSGSLLIMFEQTTK